MSAAANSDLELVGPGWYENAYWDLRSALMQLDGDWAEAIYFKRPFDLKAEVNRVLARHRYLSEWLEPPLGRWRAHEGGV